MPRPLALALPGVFVLIAAGVLLGTDTAFGRLTSDWGMTVAFALAAVTLGWRAVAHRPERVPFAVMAAGMAMYAAGNVIHKTFYEGRADAPFPSAADWVWLGMQVSAVIGFPLLGRARGMKLDGTSILDGIVTALVLSGLCAIGVYEFIYADVVAHGYAFGLAVPLLDLLVVATLIAGLAARGWRPERATILFLAGFATIAVSDCLYVMQSATGGFVLGTWLDLPYVLATAVIATAAWLPTPPARPAPAHSLRSQVVPLTAGVLSVLLSAMTALMDLNPVAEIAAVALVLAVAVRLGLTLRDYRAVLAMSRLEARTDSLTGLPNRRRLMDDLHDLGTEPCVLALFDLDGFKAFNDTYGHGAGDILLVQLASRLRSALGDAAVAYRMGGDEFCVVGPTASEGVIRTAAPEALSMVVDDVAITCSWGLVHLGSEAYSGIDALRIADQRMYQMKNGRPSSAGSQLRDVLVRVLDTREPELHDHVLDVGRLAAAVARRLGLAEHEITDVLHGAELHDVGKLAIPESILHKPGPLDDAEWAVMRRHTVIGEQFLAGIPALATAARLVRCSHERWDGAGYPDGLAGDDIPMGARVISVCDAYDAMVTDRPYRKGIGRELALAELRRCAGSQFDPAVVEAFVAEIESRTAVEDAISATHSPAAA